MNTNTLAKILLTTTLSLPTLASAHFDEGGHVGGGDQCKNEINKHRQEILNWIDRDEAKDLDFSKAQVTGWVYQSDSQKSYKDRMREVLQEGKVVITCYLDPSRIQDPNARKVAEAEGLTYKAITIGNPPVPTTCINYEDDNGISHIDCNYDLVMNSNSLGNPNFKNTHHEYASIAGVERRINGPTSDFSVSDQIAKFEHWKLVKQLGPKLESELSDDFLYNSFREKFTQANQTLSLEDLEGTHEGHCVAAGDDTLYPHTLSAKNFIPTSGANLLINYWKFIVLVGSGYSEKQIDRHWHDNSRNIERLQLIDNSARGSWSLDVIPPPVKVAAEIKKGFEGYYYVKMDNGTSLPQYCYFSKKLF